MTRESGSSLEGTVQFASSGSVTRQREVTRRRQNGVSHFRIDHNPSGTQLQDVQLDRQ